MAEENKNGGTCSCAGTCNHGDHGMMEYVGKKNRHKLLKFVVVLIFMFMSFSFGIQIGEIKGALGITPWSHKYQPMMNQSQMMYGNQSGWFKAQ